MLSFLFQLVTLPLCGEVFTRECVFTFHPFHCKACWLNKKFASYLLICSDRYCASPCFQPCPSLLPPPVLFFLLFWRQRNACNYWEMIVTLKNSWIFIFTSCVASLVFSGWSYSSTPCCKKMSDRSS